MLIKKILIFSDSHGSNNEMIKIIENEKPDYVIHAGDYCCEIDQLNNYIDYFVSGNNDELTQEKITFKISGITFFLTHGHYYTSPFKDTYENSKNVLKGINNKNIDVLIYGHTHIESVEIINKTLIINPGSITLPRNKNRKKSYAILNIKDNKILNKKINEIIKYI